MTSAPRDDDRLDRLHRQAPPSHTSSKCETEASWPRRSRQPGNDTLTFSQPDIVVGSSNELASVIAAKITRWSGGSINDLALERSEGSMTNPSSRPSILTPNGRSAATVVAMR